MDSPRSVGLSPDGDELYAPAAKSLVTFHRDSSTERVIFEQVLGNGTKDGQGQTVEKLDTGVAVTTTSDGQFVYGTADDGDTLSVYYRQRHPGAHVVEVHAESGLPEPRLRTPSGGGNRILYIMTEYPDRPVNASEAVAHHTMSRVNDYYIHTSYGKWSYPQITITPPLMMPHDLAWYNPENDEVGRVAMRRDAFAAADTAGYDPTASATLPVLRFSLLRVAQDIRGTRSVSDCVDNVRVTTHEMGHSLGLTTSFWWNVGGASIIGPGTLAFGPGNPFEPMGEKSLGDLTLHDKKSLGGSQMLRFRK